MAADNNMMRLRVVVQRNGLPETRYVLPIRLDHNPTIAKLLELVHGCTPIESDEWGLEDYAVELPAPDGTRNECLHFHHVRDVLKDDDQIFIRPLQNEDLKRRRLSGRYQISADGKHLVDGVAFGRPLLKAAPNRPSIHIPPRKRRKVLRDSDEVQSFHDDDEPGTQMLLLTNGEEGLAEGDGEELVGFDMEADADAEFSPSESDSDFNEGDGEVDEDLHNELQDLRRENAELDLDMDDAGRASTSTRTGNNSHMQTQQQPQLTLEALDAIGALRAAFPAAPVDLCEKILLANRNDLKSAYTNLKEAFDPSLPESAVLSGNLFGIRARYVPGTSSAQKKQTTTQTADDNEDDDMNDEDNSGSESGGDVDDLVKRYDRCGLPPGSISSGHGLASMAAIAGSFTSADSQATSATLRPNKIVFKDDEPAQDPADTTSSDDTSSSSGSEDSSDEDSSGSDSDDDQDDGDRRGPRHLAESENDSDDDDESFHGGSAIDSDDSNDTSSSSDSDADSDSDSGPEETTAKEVVPTPKQKPSRNNSASDSDASSGGESDSDSSSDDDSSDEDTTIPTAETKKKQAKATVMQPPVPPGQGKACTKSRNARRRAAKKAQREQREHQRSASNGAEPELAGGDPTLQTVDEKAAFEAKRQALLDALASGGIEVGPSGSTSLGLVDTASSGSKRKREEVEQQDEATNTTSTEDRSTETPKPSEFEAPTPESQKKRQRFNLDAGKRLLFGALGLRAPKTADDAEKVKSQLMKDVRPLVNARLEADKENAAARPAASQNAQDEDPDAWREKINYRAVECCQEGIVLSEPPFPFVQRWDPQQRGSWNGKKNKRGGRRKKAERNQSHYYEEDTRQGTKRKHDDDNEAWEESYYDDTTFNGVAGVPDDDAVLNYDDPLPDDSNNDGNGEASQFTDVDDLPSLPKDLAILPSLRPQDAQVGMVITWKKWSCSEATQWQPLVSDVTAVVIRVENEGANFGVCLAKRDRHLDGTEKRYDETTGQRVYGKFEAPDLDDEDDDNEFEQPQEDDGFRALEFSELLEPRIVQQAANADVDHEMAYDKPEAAQTNGNAHSDPANGLIPSIEQPSGQAPAGPDDPLADSMAVDGGEKEEDNVNELVSAQSGQSSVPLSANSSSNPTAGQAGQGHQGSIVADADLLREPSPSQQLQHTDADVSKSAPSDTGLLEDPSGYDGDLDTVMIGGGGEAAASESQNGTDSSAHTPTPFYEAKSHASGPGSVNDDADDDVPIFYDDEIIAGTPHVPQPKLKALSPLSSVQSERQPDPAARVASIEPDTYKVQGASDGNADGLSAVPGSMPADIVENNVDAADDDDPFASDDEVVSRKPAARVAQPGKDAEYEAVIRELDGLSDSSGEEDVLPRTMKRQRRIIKTEDDSGPNPMDELLEEENMPPVSKAPSLVRSTSINAPISPPAIKSSRRSLGATPKAAVAAPPAAIAVGKAKVQQSQSAFSIPPGSQVISLLSSSDVERENGANDEDEDEHEEEQELEPLYTENYADDDRDASYDPDDPADPDDSLPRGPGWVRKSNASAKAKSKKRRSASRVVESSPIPMTKRKTRLSASQADVLAEEGNDENGSLVVADSQEQRISPPASAPVQSAFQAFRGKRGLSAGGSSSSGSNSSSSTAKRSWSGAATANAATAAVSRF